MDSRIPHVSRTPKHPIQPIVLDEHKTARFKANKIVRYLLDLCTDKKLTDLNQLHCLPFEQDDWVQFTQLIGYSVSGAGDLSYMPDDVIAIADADVDDIIGNYGGRGNDCRFCSRPSWKSKKEPPQNVCLMPAGDDCAEETRKRAVAAEGKLTRLRHKIDDLLSEVKDQ